MKRTKELEIRKTVIESGVYTFTNQNGEEEEAFQQILYGNVLIPEIRGNRLFIDILDYKERLKKFLNSEAGQEYIMPDFENDEKIVEDCIKANQQYEQERSEAIIKGQNEAAAQAAKEKELAEIKKQQETEEKRKAEEEAAKEAEQLRLKQEEEAKKKKGLFGKKKDEKKTKEEVKKPAVNEYTAALMDATEALKRHTAAMWIIIILCLALAVFIAFTMKEWLITVISKG